MHRREFLALTAAAGFVRAQPGRRRPNVIVVLADDQGWGDLSVHGNSNLSTPNIDSLARDGVLFERFFVCSVCAPTRAEFLTGRYHPRGGVRGVSTGAERLNVDETTIAQVFRSAGYATAAFGKWHNGSQHPYHPNSRGFDEYYGFTSGHWGHYFNAELDHNGTLVRGKGFLADDLTDHAVRFVEQNRERPFFCYLALNTPHSPMQVPERFYKKFAGVQPAMRARDAGQEDLPHTRAALAMCENLDWNVGRLLSAVDRLKLRDDTIIVYFSDNGPNGWRWNGGMKGRKGSLDEGGLRVPCFIRWSPRIPGGVRIPQIAGAIDLLPTLTTLAAVPVSTKKPLDGKSLVPLLTKTPGTWPDRLLFTMQNRRVSVRSQRYRLDPAGKLFDMRADPMQDRDESAEQPEEAARLRAAAAKWAAEMLPLVGEDTRPYTVGYGANTLLPARDGVPHGGIRRSSQHPNCSFFTSWATKEDSMTWDVEVGRTGTYEAIVYYTCPEDQMGSTIELSLGAAKVRGKIAVAHDPPLVGAAEDRAPRTESLVKDFKPLALGRMKLEKGRGLLTLRALEIPGRQVADVRYVSLVYTR